MKNPREILRDVQKHDWEVLEFYRDVYLPAGGGPVTPDLLRRVQARYAELGIQHPPALGHDPDGAAVRTGERNLHRFINAAEEYIAAVRNEPEPTTSETNFSLTRKRRG